MEETLSGPIPRASAYPAPSADIHPGELPRLRRYDALAAMFSSFATDPQTSDSARSVSNDALRDAVIRADPCRTACERRAQSAVGSVQRSAALLHVNARLPEISTITGSLVPLRAVDSPLGKLGSSRLISTRTSTAACGPKIWRDWSSELLHFCRVFRVSFGHSPHAYITRRRIERAQGLILTTGRTLGEIALDCGFADQAHFTKIFRRLCGESPGKWRRTRVIHGEYK